MVFGYMNSLSHALTQDKACIDQNNIEQSLACLPVFLAGCQTLLVVAGPTYCSRLWCVMELFTFTLSRRLLFEPFAERPTLSTIESSLAHLSHSLPVCARVCYTSGRRPRAHRDPLQRPP